MNEQSETWDKEWCGLLTHSYGEAVEPKAGFKAGLLRELKEKQAELREEAERNKAAGDENWRRLLSTAYTPCRAEEGFRARLLERLKAKQAELSEQTEQVEQAKQIETVEQTDAVAEGNWRRLLTAAYVPCQPEAGFRARLLGELKASRKESKPSADAAAAATNAATAPTAAPIAGEPGEEAIRTILAKTYVPIKARNEFRLRLLGNLKERQRNWVEARRSSRRRTVFLSSVSSLAAAAMVAFVVWTMPMRGDASPEAPQYSPPMTQSLFAEMPALTTAKAFSSDSGTSRSVPNGLVFASNVSNSSGISNASASGMASSAAPRQILASSYRVTDAFSRPPLPATVRGIGMEMNDGNGWQPMGESTVDALRPGMAFRPAASSSGAVGLGFGDGSTVLMCPDAEMEATSDGFAVRRGTLAVTVPDGSEERFRLHFPERDVAVEPGTMLAVTVPPVEKYAAGGAPAPVIRVADGGMALARGSNGIGPLLACQVYNIDNYITPTLPGRPICASEWEDLDRSLGTRQPGEANMFASSGGFAANRMVGAVRSGTRGAAPAPAGFVKKGSRWLAETYNGQPTVKVPYLSDDYFGLANERRDLAAGLALGSEVVLDGGDGTFYEIHR